MTIYLIRHGETAWNRESRIQGREDVPLSKEGEEQAERCASYFRGLTLSAIITSPLSRAKATAERLSWATGAAVTVDERLTERDFGSASGAVIDIFNPERYADDLEPIDGVAERMYAAVAEWAGRLPSDFAVVSHGGAINALLRRLSGGKIGTGVTRLKNASVCVLGYSGGALGLEAANLDAGEAVRRKTDANY